MLGRNEVLRCVGVFSFARFVRKIKGEYYMLEFINMKINPVEFEKIRKKYKLRLILLHGSQVTGKTHPGSDIDIAFVRETNTKPDLLKIIRDLSELSGTHKVDVSDITHADPLFLYSVMRNSKLLAGKEQDYASLNRTAYHKYNDYLPFLRQEREFVLEKIKSYVTR